MERPSVRYLYEATRSMNPSDLGWALDSGALPACPPPEVFEAAELVWSQASAEAIPLLASFEGRYTSGEMLHQDMKVLLAVVARRYLETNA